MKTLESLLEKVKALSKDNGISLSGNNNKRFFNFCINGYNYKTKQEDEIFSFQYEAYGGYENYSVGDDLDKIYKDIKKFTRILSNQTFRKRN